MTVQIFRRAVWMEDPENQAAPNPSVSLQSLPFVIFDGSDKVFLYDKVDPSLAATYPTPEFVGESLWQVGDILIFQNAESVSGAFGTYILPTDGELFEEEYPELYANIVEKTEENPPFHQIGQNLREGRASFGEGTPSIVSDVRKKVNANFSFVARIVEVDAVTYNESFPDTPMSIITLDRVYNDPTGALTATVVGSDPLETFEVVFNCIGGQGSTIDYTDEDGEVIKQLLSPAERYTEGNISLIRNAPHLQIPDNGELWDTAAFLDDVETARSRGVRTPGVNAVNIVKMDGNRPDRIYTESLKVVKLRSDEDAQDPVEINDFLVVSLLD